MTRQERIERAKELVNRVEHSALQVNSSVMVQLKLAELHLMIALSEDSLSIDELE